MTEKERMLSQRLYDANADPLLRQERLRAKELCRRFNQLPPTAEEEQQTLLRQLLGSVGENCCILPDFWCDYGYNIQVGRDFFANHGLVILDGAPVRFGDHVFIGPSCGFYAAGHPLDAARRDRGLEYAWPITVGDHVWFGGGVQVLPGVSIGSDTVIGAGSVVTRDIPDHCVAVGNPCRVLRPITEADEATCWDR